MLALLRPPTHRIASIGIVISALDDAWDHERIDREINEAISKKAVEHRKANTEIVEGLGAVTTFTDTRTPAAIDQDAADIRDRHPVSRYMMGLTRYQPDAPDWDLDGRPTTASAYFKPEARPVRFIMRRMSWQEYEAALVAPNTRAMLADFVRRSLVEIQDPGGEGWSMPLLKRGAEAVPDDIMTAIWNGGRGLQAELGVAAKLFSGPLMPHEGKPSGSGDSASPPQQPASSG